MTADNHPSGSKQNPAHPAWISEKALKQSQALLASIVYTAEDGILVLDSHLRLVVFNPAAEKIFRISAPEVIGQPLDRFIPRKFLGWHDDQMRAFGEQANPHHRMGLIHEITGVRADGEEFPIEVSITAFETAGEKYYTGIIRDITARKSVENELRFLSSHDPLTRLYNRLYFEEQLMRFQDGRAYPISIIFADIDGLKLVNDQLGHAAGDDLIRSASMLLKMSFRAEDVLARLGGDEFGVILPETNEDEVLETVSRITAAINAYTQSRPDMPYPLSISIGFATARKGEDLEEIVRLADRRMYRHKAGKAHRRFD